MTSRRPYRPTTVAAAITITALTLILTGTTTPATAATRPDARNDTTTIAAGSKVTVKVLANDRAKKKAKARVKLLAVASGIKATVTKTRRVAITAAPTLGKGTYRIAYRLTDTHGRYDSANIVVKVTTNTTPPPAPDDTTKKTLSKRISDLPVATENRTGYSRDLFNLWIDADHNGCDTREEVLLAEAASTPTQGPGCTLTNGLWVSYYDNVATTDPSTFDIDHVVPLAEAWDSGANTWDSNTRTRYANDLDDPRTLTAVTATTNRSKGDRDPAEWIPPRTNATTQCRYLTEWVAIKTRWNLTVDTAEKSALRNIFTTHNCPDIPVPVTPALITTNTTPTPGTGTAQLVSITYDPDGIDAQLEQVELTNPGYDPVNLQGWTLSDTDGHTYTFPATNIAPGNHFTVQAPTGTDITEGPTPVLYAGWGAIWNNTGTDTATLRDNTGTLIDTCTYTATTGGRTATC